MSQNKLTRIEDFITPNPNLSLRVIPLQLRGSQQKYMQIVLQTGNKPKVCKHNAHAHTNRKLTGNKPKVCKHSRLCLYAFMQIKDLQDRKSQVRFVRARAKRLSLYSQDFRSCKSKICMHRRFHLRSMSNLSEGLDTLPLQCFFRAYKSLICKAEGLANQRFACLWLTNLRFVSSTLLQEGALRDCIKLLQHRKCYNKIYVRVQTMYEDVKSLESCANLQFVRPICVSMKTNYIVTRPLMNCPRYTITMACILSKLPVYPDVTNLKVCHSRNRIRKQIIPSLQFFLNPEVEKALFRFSEFYNKNS